jgi:hypothetical protein
LLLQLFFPLISEDFYEVNLQLIIFLRNERC